MKTILAIIIVFFSFNAKAESQWTDWREVGLVYTYVSVNTLHVYLVGEDCPSTKNYFSISGTQQANASQLISMILTAKASKKKVKIKYDSDQSSSHCYFSGLQIEG